MSNSIDTIAAGPGCVEASPEATATPARLCVMHVRVEPAQVWFDCPRCGVELEGYYSDPRGQTDVSCDDCGTVFDIPSSASLVIT